jgi:hypothetical protein
MQEPSTGWIIIAMVETYDRSAKCRAHAERCRIWADMAQLERIKKEFARMAEQWEALANEVELIDRMGKLARNAGRAQIRF